MMKKKTAKDYKFIKLLGEGSFSSVYLAIDESQTRPNSNTSSHNESGIDLESDSSDANTGPRRSDHRIRKYAIKVCQKSHIKRQNKQTAIMREKEIMNLLNQNPNKHFIKLYCTFQDIDRLFFVMSYAENGELLTYMLKNPLSLSTARKYSNQLLSAIEHMHKLGIVHRDLKPENILLNQNMDILITDFGSAQVYTDLLDTNQSITSDRRGSFVGTAQYVSPEMLQNRQASNRSDLWAFGVIVYQLITNVMPFNAPNEYLIYQKIQSLDYEYTDDFDPDARDLISSLIKLEPLDRLGASDDFKNDGYKSIRQHKFLKKDLEEHCVLEIPRLNVMEELAKFDLDKIEAGLDERQQLRLLTLG